MTQEQTHGAQQAGHLNSTSALTSLLTMPTPKKSLNAKR